MMASDVMSVVHGKVLVLDDKYAVVQEGKEFGRVEFEENTAGLPFRFEFSDARDERKGAYTTGEAIRAVGAHNPDVVLLDIMFGGKDDRLGLEILRELTTQFPAVPVVTMTSLGRDDIWTECLRLGAVDYLHKPLNPRQLWQTLDRYMGAEPKYWLVGQSPAFLEAVYSAAGASEGGRTEVMIMGDTGTGKELLARYIGRHGARARQPFIPIHIAPMPADQQQAELFGAKKGSYTGANQDRKGYFEAADKGIAFLDEIGDIDLRTQVNLLRVVESGEIAPLGEVKARKVDVQIVSATNANLAKKVKDGEFRHDLWERLRGMPVNLPPLAQRREDIPLLVRHLLRVEALSRKRPVPALPDGLDEKLMSLPWNGNVRELAKYTTRVFDMAGNDKPSQDVFFTALPPHPHPFGFAQDRLNPLPEGEEAILSPPLQGAGQGGDGVNREVVIRARPFGDAQDRLQGLRLEELALLYRALEQTRDPLTGAPSRAKAAALLKGKPKCNTNEFDRWVINIWNELTDESRKLATERFPEIGSSIKGSIL